MTARALRIESLARACLIRRCEPLYFVAVSVRSLQSGHQLRSLQSQRLTKRWVPSGTLPSSNTKSHSSLALRKPPLTSSHHSAGMGATAMDFPQSATSFLLNATPSVAQPSWQALQSLFVASAIPMVGFGFMDNIVMIQAGQYIDTTLGVTLGLATMTAAAAGQVVSDVSGVVFGGSLERLLVRFSLLKSPPITAAQRQLPICRNVAMLGAVVGVICGCALGACSLLFMDLEARDRINNAMQLREIVTDMISDKSEESLQCETCTVYVASKREHFTLDRSEDALKWRTKLEFLQDARSSEVSECAKTRHAIRKENGQFLYAPVVKDGEVMAVLEFKHSPIGEGFTEDDVAKVKIMAHHLGIVLKHIVE